MLVFIKLTNGFGNNLFQYIAGRLLAEFHQGELILCPYDENYYGIKYFKELNLNFNNVELISENMDQVLVTDKNYLEFFDRKFNKVDLVIDGYFEDYSFFLKHINKIKSWFKPVKDINENDLVFHLRTGDRLFYSAHYKPSGEPRVSVYSIESAINKINFNQLYIVSDLPKFEIINMKILKSYKFHIDPGKVSPQLYSWALNYHNTLIEMLAQYFPKFQSSQIHEDFNLLRSFRKIIFQHSTLAWWASFLSEAHSVGVYGPWRPYKENTNKNLSNIPLPGWYKWQ